MAGVTIGAFTSSARAVIFLWGAVRAPATVSGPANIPPLTANLGLIGFAWMHLRFKKHYTRDEARALLPEIRQWLARLNQIRKDVEKFERRLSQMAAQSGDLGGETVNDWIRALADMQEVLVEFQRRQIFIKDLERGLIDFPAIIGGREVFLCWESDDEDIEFWHDLETGYAGRERL